MKNRYPKINAPFQGEVRIIGGDWRGRKLPVIDQPGLRPSSDRVKETLFNWLQFEVAGAKCLDVFAGSGALGLEALSRGAQRVVFLEKSSQITRQIRQNLQTLRSEKGTVFETDSLSFLASHEAQTFDVVFLDPPFNQGLMQPVLDKLFEYGWLNTRSWVYLEQEKKLPWPAFPEGWGCYREKNTSEVRYGLWRYES